MKVSKSSSTSSYLVLTNLNLMFLSSLVNLHSDLLMLVGQICLNKVNLRPDNVSQMLNEAGLPIQLKAGTIGCLKIKLSYYQLLSSSI